jgi:hypothetical protein
MDSFTIPSDKEAKSFEKCYSDGIRSHEKTHLAHSLKERGISNSPLTPSILAINCGIFVLPAVSPMYRRLRPPADF